MPCLPEAISERALCGLPIRDDMPRLAYILQYSTPVRISKQIREAPWLDHLRSANQRRRKISLLRGGIFPEMLRVLRSDRHSVAFFWRRRLNQLRSLIK